MSVQVLAHISRRQPVTRLATLQIATMTELRDPQQVFDRSNGNPVAIRNTSALVGSGARQRWRT